MIKFILLLILISCLLHFYQSYSIQTKINQLFHKSYQKKFHLIRQYATNDAKEEVNQNTINYQKVNNIDLSIFSIGQQYEGKPISIKKFGAFIDIGKGINVLIPRSFFSQAQYNKIEAIINNKSLETIKLELIGINQEEKLLSGKYIAKSNNIKTDLEALKATDYTSKSYDAIILSLHDFGAFAEIEELGIEGLIPASRLPGNKRYNKGEIQQTFQKGATISVHIEELNIETKKHVFSAKNDDRIDTTKSITITSKTPEKWVQGVITSIASYGVFVRPASSDTSG